MTMQARKQSVDCRPVVLRRRIGTTGYDVICSRLMAVSMFVSLLAISTARAATLTRPHLDNISGVWSPGDPTVLGADESKMAAEPERLVVVLQAFDRKNGDSDATQWNSYGSDNKVDHRRPTRMGSTSSREKVRVIAPKQRKQKSSEAALSASSTQQATVFSSPTRGDCHRLNRLEATAAVFRRNRPRGGAAHSDSNEDEDNQQLLAELRRRFADNRTIVLCKPLSTVRTQSDIVNPLSETSSFDIDNGSNDKMTSRSPMSAPLRNYDTMSALLRRDVQHHSADKYEDDIPHLSLESVSERRRYETTPMPNDLTSMSNDVIDDNLPLAFPFPFPHRRRHSQRGRRIRRHGDHGRNSENGHNDSVPDDEGYFRCSGRQYPSTLRYFRRLESAMRACDCWVDEDDRLATDVYSRLSSLTLSGTRLSGAPMTRSEMNSDNQLQQLQCSFQRRYQACRLEMTSSVGQGGGGGGRRRTGSDVSATRHGLPYSWSQQVSDIMNPKKNISMIFY